MEIFLNIIQALSDSRFWLLPVLLLCVIVMLIVELVMIAQEEIDEWPHASSLRSHFGGVGKTQRRQVKGIQGGANDQL